MNQTRESVPIHFSFAIVNWNTKELLDDCLNSLYHCAEQEGFRVQVLVADNASSDGSVLMVREKYPDALLVENKGNIGFAPGHRPLFERSEGCYHVLVNSDVRLLPGCLETVWARMEAEPQIGVLGPQILGETNQVMPCCRRFPRLWYQLLEATGIPRLFPYSTRLNAYHLGGFDHKSSRDVDQVMGSFFVIRGSLLSTVGFLDCAFFMYYEEVDYCLRVKKAGLRVFYEAEAQVWHLGGGSSRKVKVLTMRRTMRSMRHYFAKNHGGWTWPLLLPVLLLDLVTHTTYAFIRRREVGATMKAYGLAFWDVLTRKPANQ